MCKTGIEPPTPLVRGWSALAPVIAAQTMVVSFHNSTNKTGPIPFPPLALTYPYPSFSRVIFPLKIESQGLGLGESMTFENEKLGCSVLFHVWIKSTQLQFASSCLYATVPGCVIIKGAVQFSNIAAICGFNQVHRVSSKRGGGAATKKLCENTGPSCKKLSLVWSQSFVLRYLWKSDRNTLKWYNNHYCNF